MTMSEPARTLVNCSEHTDLSRRLIVLRVTAEPTCLLTIKPKRAGLDTSEVDT